MNAQTDQISVELPADPSAPSRARRALARFAGRVSALTLSDATLLTSELVTNSYRHGVIGDTGRIRLTAQASDSVLRVEVHDDGVGFVDALRGSRTSEPGAGWGLALLDRLATRWGIARAGTTCVWFELGGAVEDDDLSSPDGG